MKRGYKATIVGTIPEEWCVRMLSDVSAMKSGESITASSITQHDPYPCYGGNGLRGYTSSFTHEGDFALIGRQGALCGNVNSASGKFFASEHAVVVTPRSGTDIHFLTYLLRELRLNRLSEASAQPGLSVSKILQLSVPLPSNISEQRAIAQALSDVDALIAALDRLIAKKRDIKQATMQQLLTGKTRLPGFSEKWETKTLGDVVEIKKGQLITSSTLKQGDIPVIAGGKQPAYYHASANRFGRTITISASGASAGYVALYNCPIFASDCSTISESESYSLEFMYYQLLSMQQTIYKSQTGGAQPHIHAKDLTPLKVLVPSMAEQVAIAAVLSAMDAELSALEARHDKTRALKQGMMQELLTGKTRLI